MLSFEYFNEVTKNPENSDRKSLRLYLMKNMWEKPEFIIITRVRSSL